MDLARIHHRFKELSIVVARIRNSCLNIFCHLYDYMLGRDCLILPLVIFTNGAMKIRNGISDKFDSRVMGHDGATTIEAHCSVKVEGTPRNIVITNIQNNIYF